MIKQNSMTLDVNKNITVSNKKKIEPSIGFQQTLREYSRVVFFQVQTHDVTC